jgi:hypothetical protein
MAVVGGRHHFARRVAQIDRTETLQQRRLSQAIKTKKSKPRTADREPNDLPRMDWRVFVPTLS